MLGLLENDVADEQRFASALLNPLVAIKGWDFPKRSGSEQASIHQAASDHAIANFSQAPIELAARKARPPLCLGKVAVRLQRKLGDK
jgi:hypothetical protein